MMVIDTPSGWKRSDSSDFRIDNDGRRLLYENEELGLEVFIEYILEELEPVSNESGINESSSGRREVDSFWGLLRDDSGEEIKGPVYFSYNNSTDPKKTAIKWLENTMRQNVWDASGSSTEAIDLISCRPTLALMKD